MEQFQDYFYIILILLSVIGTIAIYKFLNTKGLYRFWILMISNKEGVSSKRVLAIIAFILMCISYWYSIFTNSYIPDYMFEGFLYIVLAAFFFSSIDKFGFFKGRH